MPAKTIIKKATKNSLVRPAVRIGNEQRYTTWRSGPPARSKTQRRNDASNRASKRTYPKFSYEKSPQDRNIDFSQTGSVVAQQLEKNKFRKDPVTVLSPGQVFGLDRRQPDRVWIHDSYGVKRDIYPEGEDSSSNLFKIDQSGHVRVYDISALPTDRQRQIRGSVARIKENRSFVVNPLLPTARTPRIAKAKIREFGSREIHGHSFSHGYRVHDEYRAKKNFQNFKRKQKRKGE